MSQNQQPSSTIEISTLQRAQATLRSGIAAGFKWPTTQKAADKVREELHEVEEAIAAGDTAHVSEEIGDLLHATVAMAEYAGVDAETALEQTNHKFARRYAATERGLHAEGKNMATATLAEKLVHWNAAKTAGADSPAR